jgi:hypothetical protein
MHERLLLELVAPIVLALTVPIAVPIAAAATAAAATTTATAPTAPTPATVAATGAFAPATGTAATAAASNAAIERGDVFGLWTLLTLAYLELDLLSFLELAEATALDRGEVHEAILATVIRRDETVALLCIEPLHYPCRAHRALSPLTLCS